MLLLGKNPGIVHCHANVETSPGIEDNYYVLAAALKQAKIGDLKIAAVESSKNLNDTMESESTTSSSSISSYLSEKHQSEKDGLSYIAGYLAKKHKEIYPYLGDYLYKKDTAHNYCIPSWIQNLSFGCLTQPSEEWSQQVIKMDKYFQKMHKDEFCDLKEIVKRTTEYVAKKKHRCS